MTLHHTRRRGFGKGTCACAGECVFEGAVAPLGGEQSDGEAGVAEGEAQSEADLVPIVTY